MKFDEKQIAPPKNWQQFEDLCLAVFKSVWGDPLAQKNGRQGQPQAGTDISGRPNNDAERFHGVQCKGKDRFDGEVTEIELREEVNKARAFNPKLASWTLATTAKKDAAIEEVARKITEEHRAQGLFSVQVLGWDDMQSLMASYPSVIANFYPEHTPLAQQFEKLLEKYSGNLSTTASVTARKAAEDDLRGFVRQHHAEVAVKLVMEMDDGDGRRPVGQDDVAALLLQGNAVVLEAEPGAGKSTTLVQVARVIAERVPNAIPVIVPLIELTKFDGDLWDEIFSRPGFNGIPAEELLRLANEGAIVFLCDGWNELLEDRRIKLLAQFRKLRRNFPGCGLLIATRAITPLLIQDAEKLFVTPLNRAQQLEILTRKLGNSADAFLTKARRTPGLRSIIGIPLYLNALAAFGTADKLPDTKEEILRNFVSVHDGHPDHRDALLSGLNHCHTRYLRDIASRMITEGTVALPESELRKAITSISNRLIEEGIFRPEDTPNPNAALEMLVAHHILLHLGEQGGEKLFGFQHQQFLEWYGSYAAEELMVSVHEQPSTENESQLYQLLDRTDIPETIQFAIERLSRHEKSSEAAGATILRALHVDLQTAAALIKRIPDPLWDAIKARVITFSSELLKGAHHDRAIRFMGSTGKPEFADFIWAELTDREKFDRHTHFDRNWLSPSSLGPDAMKRLAASPFDLRRSILWDFSSFGGEAGAKFAIEFAEMEPETSIISDILNNLEFAGSREEANALLDKLSPEAWETLAIRLRFVDELPPNYRSKIVEIKHRQASKLSNHDRYFALADLAAIGEAVDGKELVELAFSSKFADLHIEYRALEFLHEHFPNELQAEITRRLASGDEVPTYTNIYTLPAEHGLQSEILERALSGKDARPFQIGTTARALDQKSIDTVLEKYLELHGKSHGMNTPEARAAFEEQGKLMGILSNGQLDLVVNAVIAHKPENGGNVYDLSEVLARWQDENRDRDTLPLDEGTLGRLSDAMNGWLTPLLKDTQNRRSQASHFVTAIKRVGDQRLFPLFKELLSLELEEDELDRKYKADWLATSRKPEPIRHMMGHYPIYRQAFTVFSGDEVKEYLISLLDNPTFGVDAAFELRRFGTAKEIDKPGVFGGTRSKFDRLIEVRKMRAKAKPSLSAIAAELFRRIEPLLKSGTEADIMRARSFAGAAVQMDFGDQFGLIESVLDNQINARNCYQLLEIMSGLGLPLKANWVRRGFDDELAEYTKAKWHNTNDFWVLRRWIELLALSDDPEQAIEAMKNIPEALRHDHNFHDVIYALGYSEAGNASRALIKLAEFMPQFLTTHDFLTALSRQGMEEGAEFLLSAFPQSGIFKDGRRDFDFVRTLSGLLNRYTKTKDRFFDELKGSSGELRAMYATVLPGVLQSDDVLPLLEVITGDDDPVSNGLVRACADLAIRKNYAADGQNYTIEPHDLGTLRAALLPIAASKKKESRTAYRILMAIEDAREEHGRPATEPHHPNIASGIPWPLDLRKDE